MPRFKNTSDFPVDLPGKMIKEHVDVYNLSLVQPFREGGGGGV